MDILLLIGVVVVAYIFGLLGGWNLREKHAKQVVEKIQTQLQEEEAKQLIPIKIEKTDMGYFAYNARDMMFIARGETRDELEKNLDARYPGKKFGCHPDNLREIGFQNDSV